MSTQFNVLEAKTQLSRLLDLAESGEDVVIARAGVPVVRLVRVAPTLGAHPRELGTLVGKGWISDDFDVPLPEDFLFQAGADTP